MHEELWTGVDLKYEHAAFFLERMAKSVAPPERARASIAAGGAIVGTIWQKAMYAYLDGFLAMTRSVPEVIHAGFGADPQLKKWFRGLPPVEQERRNQFTAQFKLAYDAFRALPLSKARNVSLHRGALTVEAKIAGRFGVIHVGSPVKHVPDVESEVIAADEDTALQWTATLLPVPVVPHWKDFTIGGNPLFRECNAYLREARGLIAQGRSIATSVHGQDPLTPPPSV